MISDHNLGALMGAPVSGPGDEKIGTVGQVFVDPDTGKPNWVTVHTGLFGRHESFVPIDDAEWDREVLHVPFSKDVVKDAPRIDTDQALTPEDEVSLYRYYGMSTDEVDTGEVAAGNDLDRDTVRGDGRPDSSEVRNGGSDTQPLGAAPLADADRDGRADGDEHTGRDEHTGEKPIGERLAEATRRFVDKQKSGGRHTHDAGHPDASDAVATDERAVPDAPEHRDDSPSGRTRMRRYVIVEEEVPAESDGGSFDDPGNTR